MKINDIEVTIMDFERLDKIITRSIEEINSNNLVYAKQMLQIVRDSIRENLIAESNSKQNIKIGDDVEITYLGSQFPGQARELIGTKHYVMDIALDGEYMLRSKNYKDREVDDYWFTKENLTLIQRSVEKC